MLVKNVLMMLCEKGLSSKIKIFSFGNTYICNTILLSNFLKLDKLFPTETTACVSKIIKRVKAKI